MSRQSPTGFILGMLIEIAAVVAIVALLPRVDLRPRAASSAEPVAMPAEDRPAIGTASTSVSQGWTDSPAGSNQPLARQVSYSEPLSGEGDFRVPSVVPATRREPPPLISAQPSATPQYVEERLDRASQQLVNSVGSFVTRAAGDVFGSAAPPQITSLPPTAVTSRYAPPPSSAISIASPPSFSTLPPPPPRPAAAPTTFQPRPWMRY